MYVHSQFRGHLLFAFVLETVAPRKKTQLSRSWTMSPFYMSTPVIVYQSDSILYFYISGDDMYHNLSQPLLMLSEDALCMLLLLGVFFFWWVGV